LINPGHEGTNPVQRGCTLDPRGLSNARNSRRWFPVHA